MVEELDQVARAAHIPTYRADRFAERAHLNIHAAVAIEMVDRAPASRAEHTGRVRVVNHHDATVFFGQVAQRGQVGYVAVHGKNAVGDEQLFPREIFVFLQDAFAIGDVLVLKHLDGGFRKARAVDNGRVVELVRDDEIVFAENRGNGP